MSGPRMRTVRTGKATVRPSSDHTMERPSTPRLWPPNSSGTSICHSPSALQRSISRASMSGLSLLPSSDLPSSGMSSSSTKRRTMSRSIRSSSGSLKSTCGLARLSFSGEPLLQVGNELLGVGARRQRPAVGAEPAHGIHIGGDFADFAHGLRIVGGEHQLGKRQFLDAVADPVGAPFGGVIRPGPAGDVVIQPVIEIVVERQGRAPAVAADLRGAPLVALLKAADAAQIAADAAGEMRELDFQIRQFVEQP